MLLVIEMLVKGAWVTLGTYLVGRAERVLVLVIDVPSSGLDDFLHTRPQVSRRRISETRPFDLRQCTTSGHTVGCSDVGFGNALWIE